MSRFISWLAIGVAAAFLVVVSAGFAIGAIPWVALGISIGTLFVSAGIAYFDRDYVPSLITALLVAVISAWTIVASLVFSPGTVQGLALASSIAMSGLAVVGLTANELSVEHVAHSVSDSTGDGEAKLAAAA